MEEQLAGDLDTLTTYVRAMVIGGVFVPTNVLTALGRIEAHLNAHYFPPRSQPIPPSMPTQGKLL